MAPAAFIDHVPARRGTASLRRANWASVPSVDMARSDLLDRLLFDEASGALVASFFALDGPFEGDLLHTLQGNDRDQLTLGDLFAVTMLDVSVSPRGVRRLLLDDNTRAQVTTLLSDIPDDVDIWDGASHLVPDGPAHRLWRLLQREGDRIGPTTAGKILARKRPKLLPIWDSVVDDIVQRRGPNLWAAFHLSSIPRPGPTSILRTGPA